MILSLPDLKELSIKHCCVTPEEPLPTHSFTPQRGPLNSLELRRDIGEIGEALAKSRIISTRLSLDVSVTGLEQLLMLSSEMVVELKLYGMWFLRILRRSRDNSDRLPDTLAEGTVPTHLPSLPALTTLVICLFADGPSPHFTNILCSIGSTPALTSIVIEYHGWKSAEHLPLAGLWVDVDRWLSRIAERAEVTGGLLLTLTQWPKGKLVWEGFLPEFRESGGKIKVDRRW